MGTTMTVALVEDDSVAFGHVGDSRAYLARAGAIEQLTEDHSLVAELVRGGKLSPEEAVDHPQRSVITRALGTDPDVDVDAFTVEPQAGDMFLICSDGLTTMVGDETILKVLEGHRGTLDEAAEELVKLANKAGGEDNITVIAFELTDEPDERTVEQTQQLPAAAGADDEDTLDELDAVPVVEEPRTRRRRWPFVLLLLLVVAAAIVVWVITR
jgi:protein phosphatase